MKRKKYLILTVSMILLCSLLACAPEGHSNKEYGFFGGILHGLCFPFAILGKIFGRDVGIYAENNTGFFYWIGYVVGLSGLGGGASARR